MQAASQIGVRPLHRGGIKGRRRGSPMLAERLQPVGSAARRISLTLPAGGRGFESTAPVRTRL